MDRPGVMPMSLDEYIQIFRQESGEHLPWAEARDLEAVFATKSPREIILALEDLRARIPSPRFLKALDDFHGEHSGR